MRSTTTKLIAANYLRASMTLSIGEELLVIDRVDFRNGNVDAYSGRRSMPFQLEETVEILASADGYPLWGMARSAR